MNLYRKYRPKEFKSIVGNKDITVSLQKTVERRKVHSFLFHGLTGCGKTTFARIVADQLNCKDEDLHEIDAADFRGIDTIREIRRQSQFKPIVSQCRVFILDECHMMSNDAQNALLKILEDTPNHVFFILCTTEPKKLKATVRGRCTQYAVNVLKDKEMLILLRRVVRGEEETLERKIYEQIIQDALGLPRNALTILEKVLDTEPENRLEVAKQTAEQENQSIELCRALIKGNGWRRVQKILQGLKDQDPESIRRHVLGYCQSVLLRGDNERAGIVMEEFIEPFYNTGMPGLVFACYSVIKS